MMAVTMVDLYMDSTDEFSMLLCNGGTLHVNENFIQAWAVHPCRREEDSFLLADILLILTCVTCIENFGRRMKNV